LLKDKRTTIERLDDLEAALLTISVIALDSLRANYQLCQAVGSLLPESSIKGRAAQLKAHADTVKRLIAELELKEFPF
jgi:hypothetical protein